MLCSYVIYIFRCLFELVQDWNIIQVALFVIVQLRLAAVAKTFYSPELEVSWQPMRTIDPIDSLITKFPFENIMGHFLIDKW